MAKYCFLFLFTAISALAQDTTAVFKKRVLETTEVELLGSYYKQQGIHSAVGGGIGMEELTDATSDIVVAVPLNDDDVLTFNAGFSAYTSASSGNINPFFVDGTNNVSGASRRMWTKKKSAAGKDDDDDDNGPADAPYGSPWIASTGASRQDVLTAGSLSYKHASDDRNTIYDGHVSASTEYDYKSFGLGFGVARLFDDKNSEIGVKASAYLDKWKPIYPTELHEYQTNGVNFLNSGYFAGVTVYDQNGQASGGYKPYDFVGFDNKKRNSYAVSVSFSKVLNKKLQAAVFADFLYQEGLLSTPYHRIYFADRMNYYIGKIRYIPVYDSPENQGVFRLADDVERLPSNRFKIPLGARLNWYPLDFLVLRTYYRFYTDSWGLTAHTASIEAPIKLTGSFMVYPMYRFYTQTGVRYFAKADRHFSFGKYYTSDYDLSAFDAHQYGFGMTYTDVLQRFRLLKFGFKSLDFRYNHYERSDSLRADIFSIALKFIH